MLACATTKRPPHERAALETKREDNRTNQKTQTSSSLSCAWACMCSYKPAMESPPDFQPGEPRCGTAIAVVGIVCGALRRAATALHVTDLRGLRALGDWRVSRVCISRDTIIMMMMMMMLQNPVCVYTFSRPPTHVRSFAAWSLVLLS